MIGQVYITQKTGGVTCYPLSTAADLARWIGSAYRRHLNAVAYVPDDQEENGRRVVGSVEYDARNGRWLWWYDPDA